MTNMPQGGKSDEWGLVDRLIIARFRAGWTDKKKFAAEIGVHPDTVRQYENYDWHGPRKRPVLKEWARATRQTVAWLVTGVTPTDDGNGGSLLTFPPKADDDDDAGGGLPTSRQADHPSTPLPVAA